MIGNFLGYFEKPHFYLSTAASTFWATFGYFLLQHLVTLGSSWIGGLWLYNQFDKNAQV